MRANTVRSSKGISKAAADYAKAVLTRDWLKKVALSFQELRLSEIDQAGGESCQKCFDAAYLIWWTSYTVYHKRGDQRNQFSL